MNSSELVNNILKVAGLILLLYAIIQIIAALQGHSLAAVEVGLMILISLTALTLSQLFNINSKLGSLDKNIAVGFEAMTNKITRSKR